MSTKKPEHPGKILKMIMDEVYPEVDVFGFSKIELISNLTFIDIKDLENLFIEEVDINYIIAYRLGKSIEGTDMPFWLKLQKDYDDYVELGEDDEGTPERANRDEKWLNVNSLVHSTKKWLYHYILDIIEHDDKNYKDIKRVIEEICAFQDDILKEISK